MPRKPFEVTLSPEAREDLALDLARALDDALSARSASDAEITYWHTLYEQGRTRGARNSPWADAADLTSYLGTQYVDVMRSQIVRTVMVEPVWTVEGYGEAAARAPFVEEFHQWQQEAEGFQGVFSRATHLALIEPRGVIEVYEETLTRRVRKVIRAQLEVGPDGAALLDANFKPVLARGPQGAYLEVTDESTPSAEVEVDAPEVVSRGPRMRTLASRDYLELPGHARDQSEVWGRAKRFWRRGDELRERVKAKIYDADAVEALGSDDERSSVETLAGVPVGVAAKEGTDRIEKELWELQVLKDLDGKGPRWYVVTLHKDKRQILRVQHDEIGRPRYFSLVPFPRPNSTEGYSYLGHKLITVIEEHTAWRNMLADRAAMQLQAPLKRLQGALWDPETEPIGPRAVIPVRAMNEIEPMQFPDATGPAIERIRDAERAGERLSGINDASAGVSSTEQRTLGEIQLITEQSLGRVTEAVKNIQETLEDIAQVRHVMWKRSLAAMGQEGMDLPPSVQQNIALRTQAPAPSAPSGTSLGVDTRAPDVSSAKFTAQMLEGQFRFKPRGSVETANPSRQRSDFGQSMQALAAVSQTNPMIAAILQTPQAAKAFLEQWVRLFNVQDKQAFLGSDAMAAMQQVVQQRAMAQQQAALGAGPGAPSQAGLPPGPPPVSGPMG